MLRESQQQSSGVQAPVRTSRPLSAAGLLFVLAAVLLCATATAASAEQAPTPVSISTGKSPLSVAVDSSTDMVYVANSGSFDTAPGSVSVIDGHKLLDGKPNSGKVIATIPVGHNPWGIAVDPTTEMVYVSNRGSNTVSVISGHTDKLVATVGVGLKPVGIGVVPANDTIYVANEGTGKAAGTVSVINGHTNKVVGSINVGYSPSSVGVNTASNTVYVGNTGGAGPSTGYAGTVSVIKGTNAIATVNIGGSPSGIAVDQATNAAYIANSSTDGGSNVAIINGANKLVARITLQNPNADSVTVDTAIHAVFVGDMYGGAAGGPVGSLSVINTKTNGEIAEMNVGGNPWGVAVDTTTSRVYLANDTAPGTAAMLDFSQYTIAGGAPPEKITAPIVTPTLTPTTTTVAPPPKPTTAPANTPPPAPGSFCAIFDAAGGAALGGGYPLIVGQDYGAANVCYESNRYRNITYDNTGGTEYPPAGKATVSPTGLGAGAGLWELGAPYNPALKIFFKKGSDWYEVADQYLYPPTASVAYVARDAGKIIAIARHLYATIH